jgi:hypothetical protein
MTEWFFQHRDHLVLSHLNAHLAVSKETGHARQVSDLFRA